MVDILYEITPAMEFMDNLGKGLRAWYNAFEQMVKEQYDSVRPMDTPDADSLTNIQMHYISRPMTMSYDVFMKCKCEYNGTHTYYSYTFENLERQDLFMPLKRFINRFVAQMISMMQSNERNEELSVRKVFISVPMRDRKDSDVLNSINYLADKAKQVFGEEGLIVVHNLQITDRCTDPDYTYPSLHYLGQAFERMAKCDYYIGICDPETYGYYGCAIENLAADSYGIPMILVDMNDTESFEDIQYKITDSLMKG